MPHFIDQPFYLYMGMGGKDCDSQCSASRAAGVGSDQFHGNGLLEQILFNQSQVYTHTAS
jgi:hypothetical protein